MRITMQALLARRFGLKVNTTDKRTRTSYGVGKHWQLGSKLIPHQNGPSCRETVPMPLSADVPKASACHRIDIHPDLADDGFVSEMIAVGAGAGSGKRLRRTAEEKRRVVEATLAPGASIARVAREHGVNANQVFQWRHEYRKGALWAGRQAKPKLFPVSVAVELNTAADPEVAPVTTPSGSIHIELPGGASVTVESGVDPALVRTVLESLLR